MGGVFGFVDVGGFSVMVAVLVVWLVVGVRGLLMIVARVFMYAGCGGWWWLAFLVGGVGGGGGVFRLVIWVLEVVWVAGVSCTVIGGGAVFCSWVLLCGFGLVEVFGGMGGVVWSLAVRFVVVCRYLLVVELWDGLLVGRLSFSGW